jgi:hypothetical protein
MRELTKEQKDLLLYVACPVNEDQPVSRIAFEQLLQMGLVYIRRDGRTDLSPEGEQVYRSIGRPNG